MLGANKSHKVKYIPADSEWYSYMIIAGLLSKKVAFASLGYFSGPIGKGGERCNSI